MISCEACRKMVDFEDDQSLKVFDPLDQIKNVLCDEDKYCNTMIDSYGVGIMNLLKTSTKRGDFCYNLGVCTTQVEYSFL